MRIDSRLSRMLHVLLHMARHEGGALTSEQIAIMLGTNPVVVRRTMAGLRQRGYVHSARGHGGGWTLATDLAEVTLLDIHQAVGGPVLFALGNEHPTPSCGVEKVVNAAIDGALQDAARLLEARLAQVTLADLAAEFDALWSDGNAAVVAGDGRH